MVKGYSAGRKVKVGDKKVSAVKGVKKTIVKAKVPAPPRRSPRALTGADKLPPFPRYLADPKWGTYDETNGGTFMEVTLGPAACDPTNYGSVPAANTPKVMKQLKEKLSPYGWIAGHLLNDNMGGPGIAKNLTPLTGTANKNHRAIEQKIKNAVIKARQQMDKIYSAVRKDPALRNTIVVQGVYYRVERGRGMFGPASTIGLYACDRIVCHAEIRLYGIAGQTWKRVGAAATPLSLPNSGIVIQK